MPEYCFIDMENDQRIKLNLDFSYLFENQKNGFLTHEGRLLKRDVARELAEKPLKKAGKLGKVGPVSQVSSAMGVAPSQVEDAREHYSKVDSGIEFRDNGDVKFRDRSARKKFLKAAGMIDRNSYYGY